MNDPEEEVSKKLNEIIEGTERVSIKRTLRLLCKLVHNLRVDVEELKKEEVDAEKREACYFI